MVFISLAGRRLLPKAGWSLNRTIHDTAAPTVKVHLKAGRTTCAIAHRLLEDSARRPVVRLTMDGDFTTAQERPLSLPPCLVRLELKGFRDLIVIDETEASLPAVAAAAAGPEAALPAAAAGSDPPILWEDDDSLAPYTVVEREGAIYKYYVIVEHPTDNTKLLAFCKLLPIKLDSRKRDIVHHRNFDKASNSNLWGHLQATFPDLCARLKQEKKEAESGGIKKAEQQQQSVARGRGTLDGWMQLAQKQQAATEVKEYNFGKKLPFLHLTSDFWTAKHQNKAYGTVVVAALFTKEFTGNDWTHCMAHRLHLAVAAALGCGDKDAPNINITARELLNNITKQNGVFTKSPKQMGQLLQAQGEKSVKPETTVKTRWGSVFKMYARLLRLRNAIGNYYRYLSRSETKIHAKRFRDWGVLAQVVAILEPEPLPPHLESFTGDASVSGSVLPAGLRKLELIDFPQLAEVPPGLRELKLREYEHPLPPLPDTLETLVLDECAHHVTDIPNSVRSLSLYWLPPQPAPPLPARWPARMERLVYWGKYEESGLPQMLQELRLGSEFTQAMTFTGRVTFDSVAWKGVHGEQGRQRQHWP
ncbi:hypothetical protein JKP88DRAFT_346836 [Tribonema minus]|uniref:Uncharacterized protein n=1 Tax=Tribonema minus TaxID=303371 RepID=A0A836CBV0_9STRA|nr:hypothetical protein JKP88DRAFT_346836 [Tribonema minus]